MLPLAPAGKGGLPQAPTCITLNVSVGPPGSRKSFCVKGRETVLSTGRNRRHRDRLPPSADASVRLL